MKKSLFLVIAAFVFFGISNVNAQCTPNPALTEPGFAPADSLQPCIVVGQPFAATLQFKNFDTLDGGALSPNFAGVTLKIDSIELTDITNLPAGMTYVCNPPSCVIPNSANVCITITGTLASSPDTSFALALKATVYEGNIGITLPVDESTLAAADIKYRVFIVNDANDCSNVVDTSINNVSVGLTTSNIDVADFKVTPNPISSTAVFSFNYTETEQMTFSVTDMVGRTVEQRIINVVAGKNFINFDRKNLSSGVYVMNLSTQTGRMSSTIIIE